MDGLVGWGLIGLWILWAGFLFGGFVFGKRWDDRTRKMPRWTRMASSLALVAASWLWVWAARGTPAVNVGVWLAVGMTWGFIGDLCMAHLMPLKEPVLGGMSSFGIGHVAYIIGFLTLASQLGINAPGARWGAWLTWQVFGVIGWYLVVWRGSKRSVLHKAALPYALLLASTAGVATGLALANPALWPLAVGAALFLLSDLLLAGQLFNNLFFPLISDCVWLLYGPGQMLIVYGMRNVIQAF